MAPRFKNPLRFTSGPVTIVVCFVYIVLAAALLVVHHVPPRAPKQDAPVKGVNISEAWHDLQILSSAYHPFTSRKNDEVRSWLLTRIEDILKSNDVDFDVESELVQDEFQAERYNSVVVFNDIQSNATTFSSPKSPDVGVYFEGTNIIVYIPGSRDKKKNSRGVLVNAHYDSVPTGFGATDDGVGVVTVLQLIKYYTTKGNQPKRGLVALLNNGEENYLNGAWAFLEHPISSFPDTFLNLEGAGAGGRAILFRSTDAEVTAFYKNSPHPFGNVISADGFKRGLIRSETDYVVFNGQAGMRGLDVAFMEPRSRYHTSEDSSIWTSKNSLWHMLSAAVETTKGLTSETDSNFSSDAGSSGVWWDMFGKGFGLLNAHTLFALSVTLLVVGPIAIIAIFIALYHVDREYLFARKKKTDLLDPNSPNEEQMVHFSGWRGLFRFPIAFILASAATIALAFLLRRVNPYIVYSSQYAVLSMMLSAWLVVAWFILRGADYMRPTALHRAHAYGWIFLLCWIILVVATIAENTFDIGGGYFTMIYFASVFIAATISYVEFFALPKVEDFVRISGSRRSNDERRTSSNSGQIVGATESHQERSPRPTSSSSYQRRDREDDEVSERTALLNTTKRSHRSFGFRRPRRQGTSDQQEDGPSKPLGRPYGDEQEWSAWLPSWLWVVQFLVTGPIVIILVGQIALLLISALHQTPADGSSVLNIYMAIALLSILFLLPCSPFLHRISSTVPFFLLLVLIGTILYNCLAFPFSPANRLKVFFSQTLDVDTGDTATSLTGLDGYIQTIVGSLPSASGKRIDCSRSGSRRSGLTTCTWPGLMPNPIPENGTKSSSNTNHELDRTPTPPELRYNDWITVNISQNMEDSNTKEANIDIVAMNSRGCRLEFNRPLVSYAVKGSNVQDDSTARVRSTSKSVSEIRLWSRDWGRGWSVRVAWNASTSSAHPGHEVEQDTIKGLDGLATCVWSDINTPGTIPAFDEVARFIPAWSIAVAYEDGLVLGQQRFLL